MVRRVWTLDPSCSFPLIIIVRYRLLRILRLCASHKKRGTDRFSLLVVQNSYSMKYSAQLFGAIRTNPDQQRLRFPSLASDSAICVLSERFCCLLLKSCQNGESDGHRTPLSISRSVSFHPLSWLPKIQLLWSPSYNNVSETTTTDSKKVVSRL